MSAPSSSDPRFDPAAPNDDALLAAHEKLLEKQPDDKGHYRLLPLVLLFFFSGVIFFAGTYLGHYSASFDPLVFDPHGQSTKNKPPEAAAPMDPIVLGRSVYTTVCIACHQVTGLGQPPVFPPLAGSEWVAGSEDRLIRILLHGLQGPVTVKGSSYGTVPMPGVGPGTPFALNSEKIAAVLTYIRQEWGNAAPPVSVDKVNAVRSQVGNRTAAWTAPELEQVP